jgi:hypothetical protein
LIHYIFCYYQELNVKRANEIQLAILTNLESKYINSGTIVLENSEFPAFLVNYKHKLRIIRRKNRAKFKDLFELFIDKHFNVIANNDIIFNFSSCATLKLELFRNTCFCLTRWELDGSLFREEIGDSQDTWIFGRNIGKTDVQTIGDYYLGVLGCDNRLLYELHNLNLSIMNVPFFFKTIHYHQSQIRNYSIDSRLVGGQFWLKPLSLTRALLVANLLRLKSYTITQYLKKNKYIYFFYR